MSGDIIFHLALASLPSRTSVFHPYRRVFKLRANPNPFSGYSVFCGGSWSWGSWLNKEKYTQQGYAVSTVSTSTWQQQKTIMSE